MFLYAHIYIAIYSRQQKIIIQCLKVHFMIHSLIHQFFSQTSWHLTVQAFTYILFVFIMNIFLQIYLFGEIISQFVQSGCWHFICYNTVNCAKLANATSQLTDNKIVLCASTALCHENTKLGLQNGPKNERERGRLYYTVNCSSSGMLTSFQFWSCLVWTCPILRCYAPHSIHRG